jgi:hypothetical protein
MFIIKVGQQTQDGGRNFRYSKVKDGIVMRRAWNQGSPSGSQRQDVMHHEFNSVVPDDGIKGILDLVGEEEDTYPTGFGLVLKEAVFKGHGQGTLFAVDSGVEHVPHNVTASPTECKDYKATERIDADMTSQNLTTGLILQDWVKMLLLALQKKEDGEFLVVL